MHSLRFGSWAPLACLLLLPGAVVRAAETAPAPRDLNEYGVSMALSRQTPRAESLFISLLSEHRGDPRAFNNLGNLNLMKGELAVALSFYDAALRSDSTDAGVHLNRAATLLLMGDETGSVDEAARAVRLAGGTERAAALLGLRETQADSLRAGEKRFLTPAEMRALLRKAAQAVPTSPARVRQGGNTERGQGKRTPVWRSGSTRASERPVDANEAAALLYWKR